MVTYILQSQHSGDLSETSLGQNPPVAWRQEGYSSLEVSCDGNSIGVKWRKPEILLWQGFSPACVLGVA